MKIKLLMAGLLGLVSATTFAQKGELKNAQADYDNYVPLSTQNQKLFAAKANESLTNAKVSIDKASTNEKTAELPQTYALKAAIYAAVASRDSVDATSSVSAATATAAAKKAKELDTKGEFKKLLTDANINLATFYRNKGVNEFQSKKYDLAYKSFDQYRQMLPDSADAIYVTGLAAANANNYTNAISNYNKLLTTNYAHKEDIYSDLSVLYLSNKDTTGAIKILNDGIAKYPSNSILLQRQIILALQRGKPDEITSKLQTAILNDPKNKSLYYFAGLAYTKIADADDENSAKAKDEQAKKSLHLAALDSYSKAADLYKKALDIDPEYFDATLNLGYVLVSPAVYAYNAAKRMPANNQNDQKAFEAAIAKSNAQFDLAKPYLQKAVEMNPKSLIALTNLRNYYRGKSDPAHAAENQAKAAELKKQIDAL